MTQILNAKRVRARVFDGLGYGPHRSGRNAIAPYTVSDVGTGEQVWRFSGLNI